MKKPLHVLSIDFDFFQVVDKDTLLFYPDGIDLNTELSTLVWSTKYANPKTNQRLSNITFDQSAMNKLILILDKHLTKTTPIWATNSHIHIFRFIKEQYDTNLHNGLKLINIDMHHDCINDNDELDCGNWITHVKNWIQSQNKKAAFQWLANPISKEVYGLNTSDFDCINTDINLIKNFKFDLLFLCRSDNWLPPHLDIYFDNFLQYLMQHSDDIMGEQSVTKPRNYQTKVNQLKRYPIWQKGQQNDNA